MNTQSTIQLQIFQKQHLADSVKVNDSENLSTFIKPLSIERLVNNLMYLFHISDGDYLTFILGHGECSTNKQALKMWVRENIVNTEEPKDILQDLTQKLRDQLSMEVYK